MKKKRQVTDRTNSTDPWKWTYEIKYTWDDSALDRLLADLNRIEKNTQEVIDNELMAMDLLETMVDDSANKDAVDMLAKIGVRC